MVHSEMEKILASLEKAATSDALEAGIVRLRDHYRIGHMAYLWIGLGAELLGASTYSAEWVGRYSARNYLRIDPVVLGCYQRFDPVDWQQLDWSGRAVRAFRADARAHGVGGQGLSVPIRGPHGQFALFSANHECDDATWAEFTTRHVRDLIVIAHCLNRKATQISPHRMPPRRAAPVPARGRCDQPDRGGLQSRAGGEYVVDLGTHFAGLYRIRAAETGGVEHDPCRRPRPEPGVDRGLTPFTTEHRLRHRKAHRAIWPPPRGSRNVGK